MGDFFISADRLFNWYATGRDFRLFDVRRAQALQPDSRLLPRARWRNHLEVADWSAGFDRNTPVIVNCMHGHNVSQIAGLKLRELGFTAYVLEGGIEGWIAAGRPTVGQNRLAPVEAQAPSQWVTRLGAKIDRIACPWPSTRLTVMRVISAAMSASRTSSSLSSWIMAVINFISRLPLRIKVQHAVAALGV